MPFLDINAITHTLTLLSCKHNSSRHRKAKRITELALQWQSTREVSEVCPDSRGWKLSHEPSHVG